jgi:hypothetical protein
MYGVAVASNGITFIPSLVTIGHVVQKIKRETQNQHGNIVSLLSFLKKGK